ncbi:aldehyde dehydrogenase family protein [Dactylosporangium roseum]|uniref:Aldehyde dehydrogenase family protein n=1 Tax=Dactylosporangium roseum TaxID=47989 RepID=A0ABY5ZDQ7_9ACTN|nr:aldehyde dehydrogenase family protein [Dactylosporangium roseum]UWZ39090.1 aldehyde dehydrogenase family protein [Dactylosporangium roseum]
MTEVRDPRTGRVERLLAPPSPERLRELVAGLRAAQPAWLALGTDGRAAALHAWADELAAAAEPLTAALLADTGRQYESAMEAGQVVAMARRWADAAGDLLTPVTMPSRVVPGIALETGPRPYPLVGVISPWNFPLLLGLIDAIPALAAGCAVIVKPSEVTPRFIAPLRDTILRVPALRDVVRVVEGAGDVGAALIPMVDAVCFTGSVPTGRLVGAAAAAVFIPAFLELGGKDPAIVLPGTDLERASSALLWGAVANAGQSCLSIERIYVHKSIADELVRLLIAKADQVTLAWPEPGDGMLGPLIDPVQAGIIEAQLADAVAKGATVHSGGVIEEHGGGRWIRPTVLTGVSQDMAIMQEETFGPILPVATFDTVEQAVALANDSAFGLSGAVFGPDEEAAAAVARRLDVGAVSINDAALTALIHEGEKNSFRGSGLGGSRMGAASIRRFVRKQTLITNHSPTRDPWWHTP